MVLTISTTHKPATDIGHLLRKNPARALTAELPFGQAHLFYPEATEERCTVAVVLEIDPVALVRGKGAMGDQYVNDRPYVASSFMSSAIAEFFGTAMSGISKERPELADTPIPLRAEIPVLPARGGEKLLRGLFEPLGYTVTATPINLDLAWDNMPTEQESRYYHLTLEGTLKLKDLITHLYVLIPVLDDRKHYFISRDEVDKLLRRGSSWLAAHPLKEEISKRYLKRDIGLTREALQRLSELDGAPEEEESKDAIEEAVERPISLHEQRLTAVTELLKSEGAKRVLDLGCGEGKLLRHLMKEKQFKEIVGMDVSIRTLEMAHSRLKLDRLVERQRERIKLLHGSLVYRDRRLEGYDAAAIVEVIEHLDAPRLASMERVVFEFARPQTVVITTPNREYNALFEGMEPDRLRHPDHRFEWTRAEFEAWAREVADKHGYSAEFRPIGPISEQFGAPSQMGVFRLA